MKGYVKNMTNLWAHTMKRAVGPGQTIPLDDLYAQYGKRHDIKKKDFIQWLKEVKLRDVNKWQIFTEDDKPDAEVSVNRSLEAEQKDEVQGSTVVRTDKSRGESVTPFVTKDMTVEDVVELSVRKAREVVPRIQDIQLLKYAENIANQRSGKDSLRRILMKRIEELSISSRR